MTNAELTISGDVKRVTEGPTTSTTDVPASQEERDIIARIFVLAREEAERRHMAFGYRELSDELLMIAEETISAQAEALPSES
jgi:hypothetical protein